jgi:hypothetical protein
LRHGHHKTDQCSSIRLRRQHAGSGGTRKLPVIETYQDYDPEALSWPELDEAALARLRGVPFWQGVYHTERRAGAIVDAFTPQVSDPVVREAIALQGLEETRHANLIRVLIRRRFSACDFIAQDHLGMRLADTVFG